jgi:hypothetical protein
MAGGAGYSWRNPERVLAMPEDPVVFISHSSRDREAANLVCKVLERNKIPCWIAPRDVPPGDSWVKAIMDAMESISVAVLIFSSNANTSDEVERELHLARTKKKLLIPLRIEDVGYSSELEYDLAKVHYVNAYHGSLEGNLGPLVERVAAIIKENAKVPVKTATKAAAASSATATQPDRAAAGATALAAADMASPSIRNAIAGVRKAEKAMRVALLYKRSARPDDHVLVLLEAGLREAGHEVFIDRHLRIGVEWASEIKRQVQESDAIIPLLSATSVKSEMLAGELEEASQYAQENSGKPRILPVRVRFNRGLTPDERALPEPFFGILGRLQYQPWESEADDHELLSHVLDALTAREQSTIVPEQEPGGADPLDSPYYIERPTDHRFREALDRQDSIVSVKGARQMGKTSLLARGMKYARDRGKKVVFCDFQNLQASLDTVDGLYRSICDVLASRLKLRVKPSKVWDLDMPSAENFSTYLCDEVLDKIDGHLVLALDEVDILTGRPYASETFGKLRSFHNARATEPDRPWDRLTLAIVYATEAHLLITDHNQSPFNVGTQLELEDFTLAQVRELNHRYQDPLRTTEEQDRFFALLNGQPYLTRRGFYDLTHERRSLADLETSADADNGPYGDHLKRILFRLADNERLKDVLRGMLNGQPIPDAMTFYRLRSGGLLAGSSIQHAHFRCGIYQRFLARHLG